MSLRDKIRRIRKLYPKLHESGMLYSTNEQTTREYSKINLRCLFVSDEETFLLREHVFESKKKPRSPMEWNEWLTRNHSNILRDSILPGLELRTGKFWQLHTIIGFSGHAPARVKNPAPSKRRNKANKSGKQNVRKRVRRR